LASVVAEICSAARNDKDDNYVKLFRVIEHLRRSLLDETGGTTAIPAVLKNDVVFKSVFCFLLDRRRGFCFLEELGRNAIRCWSQLVETGAVELAQKIRAGSGSEDEKTAVVVLFLRSAVRMSLIVDETLTLAMESRVRQRRDLDEGGYSDEERISAIQQGLNSTLISGVHLGKLMHDEQSERAVCYDETCQMFAAFAIVAQLIYDHGDYEVLSMMMKSQVAFEVAYKVLETVVDLRDDVSQRFLPQTLRTLVVRDPHLCFRIPFRMHWLYMYAQMELKISSQEEWRVEQQLSNTNHYCGDQAMTVECGRYAFICWLLYGLSLFDCGQYPTAEVVLRMDHLKSVMGTQPSSKTASVCIRQCAERAARDRTAPKEFLLYFGDFGRVDQDRVPMEKPVWHSIYDDPAVRKYHSRHIPDYVEICRRLTKGNATTY